VVVFVAGLLALLLPRWRRRARVQAAMAAAAMNGAASTGTGATSSESSLSPADAARLEADLARFD